MLEKKRDDRRTLGAAGEDEACELLLLSGYRLLERNFRTRNGELDIVCRAADGTVVFVEVKTDRSGVAGTPASWITPRKQSQVARMALIWLSQNPQGEVPMRFDAISVIRRSGRTSVLHYINAFLPSRERCSFW